MFIGDETNKGLTPEDWAQMYKKPREIKNKIVYQSIKIPVQQPDNNEKEKIRLFNFLIKGEPTIEYKEEFKELIQNYEQQLENHLHEVFDGYDSRADTFDGQYKILLTKWLASTEKAREELIQIKAKATIYKVNVIKKEVE